MKEGLSAEHSSELLANSLEHLLDGGGVSEEGHGHLETLGRDIADGGLDVVGDPLNEVRGVLVLNVKHLLVDFLGGHTASEDSGGCKVTSMSWVRGAHHVLGIEHLLGELWDGEGTVLLRSTRSERGETNHEEVETWEWNKVDGKFPQIRVELTWESKTAGNSRKCGRNEMVQITVGWGGKLEGSEANIIESLVINAHDIIGVLDELMDGKGGVVWLNDGIRDLW